MSVLDRLRDRVSPLLEPALQEAFSRAAAETNRRRLMVFAPLMTLVHLAHAVAFWVDATQSAGLTAIVLSWREGLVAVHLATAAAIAIVSALTLHRRSPAPRLAGPLFGALYLMHAALIIGVDQLVLASVTPYLGYALGIAVILVITPTAAVVIYGLGIAMYCGALWMMQGDPIALRALLPNGPSVSIASAALAMILYAARRRDFVQRDTISRQRTELEGLNADLERRVQDRVKEIEALNAQLHARVQTRSQELTVALQRLALRRASGLLDKGTVLADRFEIDTLIGEGGMGAVYSGVDRSNGARVAIKVIQASSARQLDAMRRFLREAHAAAAVNHPAAVRMVHVDIDEDGLLYQVQELIVGATLESRVRSGAAFTPAEAARLGSVLCDVLDAAHTKGVVHRDVKPDNVMLTETAPGLRLLDFGIAKLYDVTGADDATGAGLAIGTPDYMAPEQLETPQDATDRIDVWSVGVVLFRASTLSLPFGEGSMTVRLMRRAEAAAFERPALDALGEPAFADWVGRALARNPAARPSARELGAALAAIADAAGAPALEVIAARASRTTERGTDGGAATTPSPARSPQSIA